MTTTSISVESGEFTLPVENGDLDPRKYLKTVEYMLDGVAVTVDTGCMAGSCAAYSPGEGLVTMFRGTTNDGTRVVYTDRTNIETGHTTFNLSICAKYLTADINAVSFTVDYCKYGLPRATQTHSF